MVGITSYGAYIPLWRLNRDVIARGSVGEKAVASFDEDSITMAAAAAIDCLGGFDRRVVDGLFFASTTSPYEEKLAASVVATAADLRRDIVTADFANSLRAGTSALNSAADAIRAGSAKQMLIVASDCRLGAPGTDLEQNFGDGAGALLIGDSNVVVSLEASYSVCDEIMDMWRAEGDAFVRSSQSRFIAAEGYIKSANEAATGLMKKCNLTAKDFVKAVIALPDVRRQNELARILGFDIETQVQTCLLPTTGDTGAAYSLMLLVAALEEAKAGDRILLVSYGNGSDAFMLQVTDQIEKTGSRRGIKGHLMPKKMIKDYRTYLRWRGLLLGQEPLLPLGEIAPSALWRERDQNLRLHGAKCKVCGKVQYPPQRVCTKCHAKDQFEEVRLSDKKGELFTYSMDYGAISPELPAVISIVNFQGGGRIQCLMTDQEVDEVKLGMAVEMSLRKLEFRDGIHNYFWKCVPVRTGNQGLGGI